MTPGGTHAGSTRFEIVRAGTADTIVLAQVIAEAFLDLAVCRWLIPDQATRRAVLPWYFRLYVEHALADGLVHTTPGRDAAALWIPGTGPAEPPEDYTGQLADITDGHLPNFQAFDQALDRYHPAGTLHHHLAILAVRPDRQGHGTGTALLNAHHTTLDHDGLPAYLEASDHRTRRLYLNHGYTDHGPPIRLPDGPTMWPMWRQPHTGNQPASG